MVYGAPQCMSTFVCNERLDWPNAAQHSKLESNLGAHFFGIPYRENRHSVSLGFLSENENLSLLPPPPPYRIIPFCVPATVRRGWVAVTATT